MNPSQLVTWINVAGTLVNSGTVAWTTLHGWIKSNHPGATDAELDAIAEGVKQDALRRAAIAQGDAGLPPTP